MTFSRSRLCIVAPEFIGPFPNGGVGTACYWEAMTLGALGHDVTVLYTGPTERETPPHWERHFAQAAPFRFVDLGLWIGGDRTNRDRSGYSCAEAQTAEHVLAYLRAHAFDLVLFQEFLGHGARAIQAQDSGVALAGTRTATTLHSCRQWIYQGMRRLPGSTADLTVDFLERESARRADAALAPSRHMAEWATAHWHLDREPAVVPYCYDASLVAARNVLEHAGPFRHLVFFGRLETRKGLHLFCRALAADRALSANVEHVTFLGKQSIVDGRPSDVYIRRTLGTLPRLSWELKGDLGSLEALTWLCAQRDVLVVAPSLVDNLPYSLIELYSRRIPFVSTRIGGIPEIVGAANAHALATATENGVAEILGRVYRDGHLTIDYRDGYDIASANRVHEKAIARLLTKEPSTAQRASDPHGRCSVVVTNASDRDAIDAVRARAMTSDPDVVRAKWMSFDEWRGTRRNEPAIFVDAEISPAAGWMRGLLGSLDRPGVDAATSYYARIDERDEQTQIITPLGASLELGWSHNCFGGPSVAVVPRAFRAVTDTWTDAPGSFWALYASLACANFRQAMVPDALYSVPASADAPASHEEIEAVLGQYHAHAPATLDLGWLLKAATAGVGARTRNASEPIGPWLYKALASRDDDHVATEAFATGRTDHVLEDILALRDRLTSLIGRWQASSPRVFVYGAGQHAKLMLQVCPQLGAMIAGFIDRRPLGTFLGKPCITPDAFDDSLADGIVYSSREFEHEMYARMQASHVEHVLLYHPSPTFPETTTASRLQRRFGHASPDLATLHAIYQPPAWATGYISGGDAEFLYELIAAHQPRTVVELGVASGASSAAILAALDQLPDITGGRVLYSCDVRSTCYFDEKYATGQACGEMYPNPRARWRTEFDSDARRLARTLPRASVDLTFIDANHAHPWPLLDLLHVTAVARPRSWVVLHDLDLPIHHPEYQVYGPRWLFEAWPFNKVKGVGRWTSIGAVQLPDDPAALIPVARTLLERPWEHAPTIWHINLPASLSVIQHELQRRLAPADTAAVAS